MGRAAPTLTKRGGGGRRPAAAAAVAAVASTPPLPLATAGSLAGAPGPAAGSNRRPWRLTITLDDPQWIETLLLVGSTAVLAMRLAQFGTAAMDAAATLALLLAVGTTVLNWVAPAAAPRLPLVPARAARPYADAGLAYAVLLVPLLIGGRALTSASSEAGGADKQLADAHRAYTAYLLQLSLAVGAGLLAQAAAGTWWAAAPRRPAKAGAGGARGTAAMGRAAPAPLWLGAAGAVAAVAGAAAWTGWTVGWTGAFRAGPPGLQVRSRRPDVRPTRRSRKLEGVGRRQPAVP